MSEREKKLFITNRVFQTVINSILFFVPLLVIEYYFFHVSDEDIFSARYLAVPIIGGLLISGIWIFLNAKKWIEQTEAAFTKKDFAFFFR
ncbi:MAG: hypothetical protein WCX61_01400 [Candidatus Peribacteraceae bacterium]|jgi:K+ transporter